MNRHEFLRLLTASAGATAVASACGGSNGHLASADQPGTHATPPTPAPPQGDAARRDKLIERMLEQARGTFELLGIYLGDRLGLYAALAAQANQTSTELAAATKTNERYIREWLEHQTVSGIVDVQDAAADAKARRYSLPKGHQEVLVDTESLNYLAPLPRLVTSTTAPLPQLLAAYKTGTGVPWSAYGADAREGQGAFNRTTFLQLLGKEWLPAIPDVDARLKAKAPARVADIGCGVGWSSIAMAKSYPNIRVDGYDIDAPSIELAKANAKAAGVGDRVTFYARDASEPKLAGSYDLVTAFEMVHDLSRPVGVLQTMHRLAGANGSVLIVDERVGEKFDPRANEVERMMYGWSILMCLPTGKDDTQSAETGTVMRPSTLEGYAREAGFSKTEVLPIDNYFFRLYRLRP